jgi:acyl carrier protein
MRRISLDFLALRHLVSDTLELDELIPEDASRESIPAWDSLAMLRIAMALSEILGDTLNLEELLPVTSIAQLAEIVAGTE